MMKKLPDEHFNLTLSLTGLLGGYNQDLELFQLGLYHHKQNAPIKLL
jgi:hypothetical protein